MLAIISITLKGLSSYLYMIKILNRLQYQFIIYISSLTCISIFKIVGHFSFHVNTKRPVVVVIPRLAPPPHYFLLVLGRRRVEDEWGCKLFFLARQSKKVKNAFTTGGPFCVYIKKKKKKKWPTFLKIEMHDSDEI